MARAVALKWAEPALNELDDIAAWIAGQSPVAAAELVDRVLTRVEMLRRFPSAGRRVPEVGGTVYREIVVPPLRVVHRRAGSAVLIVHVMRGERLLRQGRLR